MKSSADGKLDLFQQHKMEYATSKTPALIEVGAARYLAIDGQGEPGAKEFQVKVKALYSVAYTLKFMSKKAGHDYKVAPLEGLWGVGKGSFSWDAPRDQWRWKLLIRVPDFIEAAPVSAAKDQCIAKTGDDTIQSVRLETITEGQCVQVLHVGPYGAERESVEAMERFADERGMAFDGSHHEIYLSDPRRVAPGKLKTILRHPVKPK
ncbi:MAG: GyrI-like domain-containing protein [Chloroflexi bacterium]|nr:GyrI-like domain-containing protein [Chloroflexota bacterium]